jgi:hypothetical protein
MKHKHTKTGKYNLRPKENQNRLQKYPGFFLFKLVRKLFGKCFKAPS